MKNRRIWTGMIMGLLLLITVTGCMQNPVGVDQEEWATLESAARNVLDGVLERDYGKASQSFSETLKVLLPEAKLFADWEGLEEDLGPYEKLMGAIHKEGGDNPQVALVMRFEKGYLDMVVTLNREYDVELVNIMPSTVVPGVTEYAVPGVVEQEVTIGEGEAALPGTLSYPEKTEGPVPVVILVHGSGPNDRDESIYTLRPFRDIAWGLGEKGIAVLRYDKRSKTYPEAMAELQLADTLTVKEEVVDDVALVYEAAKGITLFEVGDIYILGHSLGGMLIPRIAAVVPDAAGYMMLAAPARPMEDLILEQYTYILGLEDSLPAAQKDVQLAEIKKQVDNVKNLNKGDGKTVNVLLGMNAAYHLDLKGYDPATAAKEITKPLLILQGERDYQVTMVDFGHYQVALGDKENVVLQSYPALNHMFIPGEGGMSTPLEYYEYGRVPDEVMADIAAFVWD
ncbi:alpha/beta hydrolase [Eubacteriales bacterium OttesenSCG-928-M02]|nr:alpha/beta hydrolase [Eubacteriales bacterium OttesenSCG-928-M02]